MRRKGQMRLIEGKEGVMRGGEEDLILVPDDLGS